MLPSIVDADDAGQPGEPDRQSVVSGVTNLLVSVMVPVVVEKATVVPAGMELPFSSTMVTMNFTGLLVTSVLQEGKIMSCPPLIVTFAFELENTITWLPRTSIDF